MRLGSCAFGVFNIIAQPSWRSTFDAMDEGDIFKRAGRALGKAVLKVVAEILGFILFFVLAIPLVLWLDKSPEEDPSFWRERRRSCHLPTRT